MSLINDMLKNLEKRPHYALASDSLIAGLRTDISLAFHRNRKYYIIIAVLFCILLTLCVLLIEKQNHSVAKNTDENQPVAVAKGVPEQPAVVPVNVAPTQLSGVTLQMQQGVTYLRFLLNQNPLYQLSSNAARNELTIMFENTHLMAELPKINYAGSGIQDVQAFDDGKNNLKLVLHLNPNAEVKRLELNQDGKAPELQMDVAYNTELKPPQTVSILKKPVAESGVEQRYQQALHLSAMGQIPAALEALTQITNDFPAYSGARESLVALLLQQNDKVTANKVLDVGLQSQPNLPAFLKLKARLLLESGNPTAALTLLLKQAPPISSDPEYHALLAALYQRTGQTTLASELYKQLLVLQPSNAKWWVGLGIALQANGNNSQALEAFSNADAIGGLSPELKAYLDTQLNTA